MGRKSVKTPAEDASVIAQRERQVLDLAALDDEENRRIKQMRSASRGVRAFRAMRSSTGEGSVLPGSSSAGSAAAAGRTSDPGFAYGSYYPSYYPRYS